jgi:tRNA-dihydrouridine synthase B
MKRTLRIQSLKARSPYFLAPMHEVNDIAFRTLCKKYGAGLTYTGLLNPQTREKLILKDKPAVQFACNNPKGIKEFIRKYDKKVSLYDLNLGCPSPNARQSKVGYFMIEDFQAIEDILNEIKDSTKKPVTIKIRKMPENITKKIISIANKYCDAIAVHPRTQKQGYSGIPDLEFARKIKILTNLPIIYSGNITNKEQADKILKEFNLVMIGRASIGNPGIFRELTNKNKIKVIFRDYLNLAERYHLSFSQIKFQALNFTRGFSGTAETRNKICLAKKINELLKIIKA